MHLLAEFFDFFAFAEQVFRELFVSFRWWCANSNPMDNRRMNEMNATTTESMLVNHCRPAEAVLFFGPSAVVVSLVRVLHSRRALLLSSESQL